jgi:tetratricopeptide (TPR) repeat protein
MIPAGDPEPREGPTPDLTARNAAWLGIGFAALILAVYGAALRAPFVSDDAFIYVDNPYTAELTFENLVAILDPWGAAKSHSFNYAPVHLLLSAAERQLFGSQMLGYHLVSALLHALNSVLLVALLCKSRVPRGAAVLGGALFAFHPANVEAVAWAFQLKSVCALSFGLGAVLALRRHPVWATVLFALALLTKITAVAFLPMAAAFAWVRGSPAAGARRWVWIGGWACVTAAVTFPQLAAFGPGGGLEEAAFADPLVRLRSSAAYGARYLVMAATGLGVSAFHEPAPAVSPLDHRWLAGLAMGILLGWRLLFTLRQRREEAAWWIGAAAAFVPVSQLASFRFPIADRYLYFILPGLIGGTLLLATTAGRVWTRRIGSPRGAGVAARAALAAGAALALVFALHSAQRARLWTQPFALIVDAARHYPSGSQAHYVRAVQAAQQGEVERAVAELRAAEEEKRISLVMNLAADPYLAPIRDEPAFREFLLDTARRRIELARQRGIYPGEELVLVSAHEALGEYDEAIAMVEGLLRRGDDRRRPLLLATLERLRARKRESAPNP